MVNTVCIADTDLSSTRDPDEIVYGPIFAAEALDMVGCNWTFLPSGYKQIPEKA